MRIGPVLIGGLAAATLVAALVIEGGRIEHDLAVRAQAALSGLPLSAAVDGRNVTLVGLAGDERERDRALIRLAALDGVAILDDHALLAPAAAPFAFSAMRDAGRIVLMGSVPDAAAADRLVAIAQAQEGIDTVVDLTRPAAGAPEGWDETAAAAIAGLGTLQEGRALLIGEDVEVTGHYARIDTEAAFAALGRPGWRVLVTATPAEEISRLEDDLEASRARLEEQARAMSALADRAADLADRQNGAQTDGPAQAPDGATPEPTEKPLREPGG